MAETSEELKAKLALYEQNGSAKLYYSLNRKMNEMADLMNKNNLAVIPIEDPKDKTHLAGRSQYRYCGRCARQIRKGYRQ
jgi:hypothetical protein